MSRSGLFGYMTLEGESQGKIEGGCTRTGDDFKNTIQIWEMEHKIGVDYDRFSHSAKGETEHEAIVLIKEWDKASPKLHRAMVTGEHLKNVQIKWFRSDSKGNYVHFYTHAMEDAHIVELTAKLKDHPEKDFPAHVEEVKIAYRKMTWTWKYGNIEAVYDYADPSHQKK